MAGWSGMHHHLVRRLNDLLDERLERMERAGSWSRTSWEWRQDWRRRMELLTLDCRELGQPGHADAVDKIARLDPSRVA